VSKVTLPTDRAWAVSFKSFVSCSISEILHVNPQTYFGQFRGTSGPWPTFWQLDALPLKGFEHPPNTVTVAVGKVCAKNLASSSNPLGHNTLAFQADRQTDEQTMTKASPYGRAKN